MPTRVLGSPRRSASARSPLHPSSRRRAAKPEGIDGWARRRDTRMRKKGPGFETGARGARQLLRRCSSGQRLDNAVLTRPLAASQPAQTHQPGAEQDERRGNRHTDNAVIAQIPQYGNLD
jgi:hypothetical protein